MGNSGSLFRAAAAMTVLGLLAVVSAASLLPLIETNVWWIRYLDFPRVQFALALVVLIALYFGIRGLPRGAGWIVIAGAVAAIGYHVYKLHPYTRMVPPDSVADADCPDGHALRLMIANLKKRNEDAQVFLDEVAETDPDLLLAMETDAWWDERLSALNDRFARQIQSIPEDDAFYGMHLFSKLELIEPEFLFFFGQDTPTVATGLRLPAGDTIDFIGLHPRPPLALSQPSTMRDAHILKAALRARESGAPTILAGDFNAVPWERVTRRAMRIGGLLDPRVGRGLFPTYDTHNVALSWPLDQILYQPDLTLRSFATLPDFGSDHRPVVATLCHRASAVQDPPALLEDDIAEAETSLEAARSAEDPTN